MDIAIKNGGKVCSRYNFYRRHSEPLDVKEVGDTGYIDIVQEGYYFKEYHK